MSDVCNFLLVPILKLREHLERRGIVKQEAMEFAVFTFSAEEAFVGTVEDMLCLPKGSKLFVHAPADPNDALVRTTENGSFEVISGAHKVSARLVSRKWHRLMHLSCALILCWSPGTLQEAQAGIGGIRGIRETTDGR
jgi:hypothetical protein